VSKELNIVFYEVISLIKSTNGLFYNFLCKVRMPSRIIKKKENAMEEN
jgi:hypothetical protein